MLIERQVAHLVVDTPQTTFGDLENSLDQDRTPHPLSTVNPAIAELRPQPK
jgi:hypothetical protein